MKTWDWFIVVFVYAIARLLGVMDGLSNNPIISWATGVCVFSFVLAIFVILTD